MLTKRSSKLTLLFIFILLFILASPVQAKMAMPTVQANAPAVQGELVVSFKPGTPDDKVADTAAKMGAEILSYDPASGLALFKVQDGKGKVSQSTVYSAMGASSEVILAEPNYLYSLDPLPGDSLEAPARPESRTVIARDIYTGLERQIEIPVPPLEVLDIPDVDPLDSVDPNDPAAEVAASDGAAEIQSTSYNNDAYVQWGWDAIQAEIVWQDKTKAYEVAVLDTGADLKHPDLKGVLIKGYDWVNNDGDPSDDHGHGTHVAGIIAARTNNATKKWGGGIPGVSNGKLYIIKVASSQGIATTYDIARGLRQAADRSYTKVINLSLGGPNSAIVQDEVAYAIEKGKLLVVAAGNKNADLVCDGLGGDGDIYPACLRALTPSFAENIIVVAASGYDVIVGNGFPYDWAEASCKAEYSNYGDYVDIIAPGTDIYSTLPSYPFESGYALSADGDPYGYASGTSMAAPHVAGAAARVWAEFPLMTATDVKAWLLSWYSSVPSAGECGASPWPSGAERPFLWLAGAMQQAALEGKVYSATTGAALPNTGVQALRAGVVVSKDKLCKWAWCDGYSLRSIPIDDVIPIDFRFSAKNHTAGYQTYFSDVIDWPGYWTTDPTFLPEKAKHWNFVTTWTSLATDDVDSYLFMPDPIATDPSDPIVWVGARVPYAASETNIWGLGALHQIPYTRVVYESGIFVGDPGDAGWGSRHHALDTIDLQVNPGTNKPYYPGDYTFLVANNWDSDGDPPEPIADVSGACAYVWYLGTIKYAACLDSTSTDPYWIIGSLNGTVFTPINTVVADYSTYTGGWVFSESLGLMGPIPPH